jgi:hypothetical protein
MSDVIEQFNAIIAAQVEKAAAAPASTLLSDSLKTFPLTEGVREAAVAPVVETEKAFWLWVKDSPALSTALEAARPFALPGISAAALAVSVFAVRRCVLFVLETERPKHVDVLMDEVVQWLEHTASDGMSKSFSTEAPGLVDRIARVGRYVTAVLDATRWLVVRWGNLGWWTRFTITALLGYGGGYSAGMAGLTMTVPYSALFFTALFSVAQMVVEPTVSDDPRPGVTFCVSLLASEALPDMNAAAELGLWSDGDRYCDWRDNNVSARVVVLGDLAVFDFTDAAHTPVKKGSRPINPRPGEERRQRLIDVRTRVVWRLQAWLTQQYQLLGLLVASRDLCNQLKVPWFDRLHWHQAWFMPVAASPGLCCWVPPQTALALFGRYDMQDALTALSMLMRQNEGRLSRTDVYVEPVVTRFYIREMTRPEYLHIVSNSNVQTTLGNVRPLARTEAVGFVIEAGEAAILDGDGHASDLCDLIQALHCVALVYGYVIRWDVRTADLCTSWIDTINSNAALVDHYYRQEAYAVQDVTVDQPALGFISRLFAGAREDRFSLAFIPFPHSNGPKWRTNPLFIDAAQNIPPV